jgi:sensor histidine kinase YesM
VGVVCMGIFFFFLYSLSNISGSAGKSTEALPEAEPEKHEKGTYIGAPFAFLYIVTLFYFALNYYYNLIVENKRLLSFLKVTGLLVLASYIFHLILYYYIPSALRKEYESPGQILSSLLPFVIPMLIMSFLFAYITNMREAVKQRRILQEQKLQLEAQISQANFNFLKAQINPHFLHNTLNFLYAKSIPYSAELSEGILTLSDIMRYALSQGNQKDGKAPLKDEIEHVHNVIKISQLRFSNQLKVNFEVNGNVEGKMIIPFVLITLVENAFKHGDLKNPDYPIDIKVNLQGDRLSFYCRNKKKPGLRQLSTGIGLDNIKKRLDLAYGNNYKYIVKDDPEFYTVELIINKL